MYDIADIGYSIGHAAQSAKKKQAEGVEVWSSIGFAADNIFLLPLFIRGEYIIMLWPDAVRVATSQQKQCVIVAEEAGGREGSGT